MQILPGLFYDIKYAVGGIEKGVDACFVERITVVSRGAALVDTAVVTLPYLKGRFDRLPIKYQ